MPALLAPQHWLHAKPDYACPGIKPEQRLHALGTDGGPSCRRGFSSQGQQPGCVSTIFRVSCNVISCPSISTGKAFVRRDGQWANLQSMPELHNLQHLHGLHPAYRHGQPVHASASFQGPRFLCSSGQPVALVELSEPKFDGRTIKQPHMANST